MKNFEKYARQNLENYASPVDTQRLWEKIAPPPKRRIPLFIWWLSGAFAGLLIAGFLVFRTGQAAPARTPASSDHPTPVAQTESAPQAKETDSGKAVPEVSATADARTAATTFSQNAGIRASGKTGSAGTAAGVSRKSRLAPAEADPSPAAPSASANAGVIAENTNAADSRHTTRSTEMLPGLPFTDLALAEKEKPVFAGPEQVCYSFKSRLALLPYFGMYGGVQYPFRKLEAKNPASVPHAQQRRDSETVLEAVTAGAFLGLRLSKGLFVEAGGEYQRITERFDWSSSRIDTIGRIAVTGIIVNAPGDTTFIQDSSFITQTTRHTRVAYNRYHFLSVPIALGYTWNRDGKFQPYVRGGAAINLFFRQKTTMLDDLGVPGKYPSENPVPTPEPYRSSIGIVPFVSLGMRYEFASAIDLFAELRYQHHLKEITADDYPIRQQYGLAGAQVGVCIKL